MATKAQIAATRLAKLAAYEAALDALISAWIEVRSYDIACDNHNVSLEGGPAKTFGSADGIVWVLKHGQSAGASPNPHDWQLAARAAAEDIINSAT